MGEEFIPYIDKESAQKMREKPDEKFSSMNYAEPADIVSFWELQMRRKLNR